MYQKIRTLKSELARLEAWYELKPKTRNSEEIKLSEKGLEKEIERLRREISILETDSFVEQTKMFIAGQLTDITEMSQDSDEDLKEKLQKEFKVLQNILKQLP